VERGLLPSLGFAPNRILANSGTFSPQSVQQGPALLIPGFFERTCRTPRVVQEATQTHAVIGLVSARIRCALVAESARSIGLRGVAYRPVVAGFLATARRAAHRF